MQNENSTFLNHGAPEIGVFVPNSEPITYEQLMENERRSVATGRAQPSKLQNFFEEKRKRLKELAVNFWFLATEEESSELDSKKWSLLKTRFLREILKPLLSILSTPSMKRRRVQVDERQPGLFSRGGER